MGQRFAERTVVGEDEQSFAVHIQAADRENPGRERRQQIIDRRPLLQIHPRREIADGFVKEDIQLLREAVQRLIVERNDVMLQVHPGIDKLFHFAVDADAALQDPFAGLGARGNALFGERPHQIDARARSGICVMRSFR